MKGKMEKRKGLLKKKNRKGSERTIEEGVGKNRKGVGENSESCRKEVGGTKNLGKCRKEQ